MRYFLLFSLALTSVQARSSVILNTNPGGTPQTLGFTFGTYGQGVAVGENTTLHQIGIWIGSPAGGTAEFQIWDGSNSTLLYSQTKYIAAASGTELILSDPFSFELSAGNTYYFDVIGPYSRFGDQELGFVPGTTAATQNHLTPVWPNSVYLAASQPSGFAQGNGFTLPIELIGTQQVGHLRGDASDPAVPEPGTIGLAAFGCMALAAIRRSV